jgi:heat shock protein HslJ
MTADFANGQVTGTAGCNSFNASYQTSGNTISVGPTSGGMMMCAEPAGVMEQESQFLAALQSAATFRITGDTLELRTAGDQIAVTFNRAP